MRASSLPGRGRREACDCRTPPPAFESTEVYMPRQQLSSRQRILLRIIVVGVIILLLALLGLLGRNPAILHSVST